MADKNASQGLPDEDLWSLIRRFDKQVSHVQTIPQSQVRGLDLNRAAEERFPPAKLQKTIERFYISVLVKVGLFFNHVNWLRSWSEPRRTGIFGAVYLVAWLCDCLIPVIVGVLLAMIVYPPVRPRLFPPIPEPQPSSDAADDKPAESTETSVHVHHVPEGREAEQEATEFVNDITTSITEGSDEPIQAETPDPANLGITAGGETAKPKKKAPPAIKATMRVLSDISDLSERIANLLSPTPPFNLVAPRLGITLMLLSVCLVSVHLSSQMIVKTCSLTVGLAFFGDPVLSRAITFLNGNIPNWKSYLDIEKTLLKGVPTNAQLTLTLLRLGELNSTPLIPPAPTIDGAQSPWQLFRRKSKKPETEQDGDDKTDQTSGPSIKSKPKKWRRFFRFARRAIATAIKGHTALNQALAITGSGYAKAYAKEGLRALLDRNPSWMLAPSLAMGPSNTSIFEAKFERKRGAAVLDMSDEENPVLYFSSKQAGKLQQLEDLSVEGQKVDAVGFQIPVGEIRELKKTEGLGWKGKLVVQIASGSNEGAANEGLVIQGMEPEQTYILTDMRGRNQLFNRLVAGGAQCWEMY
ncbi:hypothetical protein BDW62DRAFT_200801 [Aspergillus aurantiobrunneus]